MIIIILSSVDGERRTGEKKIWLGQYNGTIIKNKTAEKKSYRFKILAGFFFLFFYTRYYNSFARPIV